jgi:hypothetical protein
MKIKEEINTSWWECKFVGNWSDSWNPRTLVPNEQWWFLSIKFHRISDSYRKPCRKCRLINCCLQVIDLYWPGSSVSLHCSMTSISATHCNHRSHGNRHQHNGDWYETTFALKQYSIIHIVENSSDLGDNINDTNRIFGQSKKKDNQE